MEFIAQTLVQVMTAAYGLKHGEKGQGMAEYGLILALVAVVVIVALTTLGNNVSSTFNTTTTISKSGVLCPIGLIGYSKYFKRLFHSPIISMR